MEVDDATSRERRVRLPRPTTWWVASIVLVGALLRFIPIWFGLPLVEARPDEETAIGHAIAILGGDLNPHFSVWPSGTFYLFAACFAAASWIQSVLDVHKVLTPNQYFIIARAVVALAGTSTIVVLFTLTKELADDVGAAIAALFLAVATLHVRESHFAMTDVLMTLFAMVSLTLLIRAFRAATPAGAQRSAVLRSFAVSGFAAGLATSTKYNAAAMVAAMAAAQALLLRRSNGEGVRWRTWMPAAAFGVAFMAGFALLTPYVILDYPAYATGVSFDVWHLSNGHGIDLGSGWIYHLRQTLPAGVSVPICIAALAGIVPAMKRDAEAALIVAAFCATLYGAMASGHTVFFRYVLPLVPPICLLAGVAVSSAAAWLARRIRVSGPALAAAAATAIAMPALVNSVRLDVLLATTDTRVVAGRWLADHVQPDDSLYDAGGTYAEASLAGVRAHVWSRDAFDPASSSFKDAGGRIPDWLVLPRSPLIYTSVAPELQRLAADRYELVNLVRATTEPDPGVYDPQDAFFLPIAGFSAVLRPGPTLLIYRRRPEV